MAIEIEFNETELYHSLADRFRHVAAHLPDNHLAMAGGDEGLSYGRLNELSDQLAARLLDLAGSEPRAISLLLPSMSHAGVIAALGVIKAGHFFLPLDTNMPDLGLREIFQDCPTPILIANEVTQQQAERLRQKDQELLFLEDLPVGPVERSWPEIVLNANAALYYTSGSTGKPRGVLRTHQHTLRAVHTYRQYMSVPTLERIGGTFNSQHSSSGTPMWCALLNGASLHNLAVQGLSPSAIYTWLEKEQITYFQAIPGVLRSLAELAVDHPPLPALRALVTGMEPIKKSEMNALLRLMAPGGQFANTMSSTEVSLFMMMGFNADTPLEGDFLPVGRVLPFVDVYIVDENGVLLPAGQTGEIWVRSHFKMGGYWSHPELTLSKMADSPVGGEPFFRTGDLGVFSADGVLYFKGRVDRMVKVRGYRIQLEEVEDAVNGLPGVKEAAVIARESHSGEKYLAAYLFAPEPEVLSLAKIRKDLAKILPMYKIPARFVFLSQPLPKTASGKLDRQALPAPVRARPALDGPFREPQNEIEQGITTIWANLLELDRVGADDNFFELGGDSLSSLTMILRVEQLFHVAISPEYFRQPTVAHLAELVASASMAAVEDLNLAPLAPRPPRLQRWDWDKMVGSGPMFEKFSLPYSAGVKVQRVWLSSARVRRTLFKPSIDLVREWAARVGDPDIESATQRSLLANTWWAWRCQQLAPGFKDSRWLKIQGDRSLWMARPGVPGVLFLVLHSHLTNLFIDGLQSIGRKPLLIRGVTPDPIQDQMGISVQMHQAYQVLARGEPVMLAGDGFRGKNGVSVPFWGETRMFRYGGAELAVQTGVELVPVFSFIQPDGRVTIEVCEPLARGNGSAEEQVETLTRSYAELFTARWPQVYSSELWAHLRSWKQKNDEGLI
jgi:acyl-CoA synthetase (AMP-forming)/AMP-acid ligase II/acyl carrier protein